MDQNYSENAYILKRKNDDNYILIDSYNDKYSIVTNVNDIKGKLYAIHKRDEEILLKYLNNSNVKIEWYTNYGDHPYIWDDYYLEFIKNYDEQEKYRLKA